MADLDKAGLPSDTKPATNASTPARTDAMRVDQASSKLHCTALHMGAWALRKSTTTTSSSTVCFDRDAA